MSNVDQNIVSAELYEAVRAGDDLDREFIGFEVGDECIGEWPNRFEVVREEVEVSCWTIDKPGGNECGTAA